MKFITQLVSASIIFHLWLHVGSCWDSVSAVRAVSHWYANNPAQWFKLLSYTTFKRSPCSVRHDDEVGEGDFGVVLFEVSPDRPYGIRQFEECHHPIALCFGIFQFLDLFIHLVEIAVSSAWNWG